MKPFIPKRYFNIYYESARNKVLEILFKYSEKEFSLSELANEAKVRKANIGNVLDEFLSNDLIKIEKLSKIWRIRANQDNPFFIKNKITYNLNFIYQTGLVEFLVDHFKNPKSIILFGSFRKGDNISSSDIDIAIEDDVVKEYQVIRIKELANFEKKIGKEIQIHKFNKKIVDLNVFNNIANGIVLSGFLEVNK